MNTLPVFSQEEFERAKLLLAAQVASMMGRKLEEGDWSDVYCKAKGIPVESWSNLHIDVNFNGLGVEFKMLRIPRLKGRPMKEACGTTLMHPSATRSVRIDDTSLPANDVMRDVFAQYSDLISARADRVRESSGCDQVDMRFGWLLWEDELKEFLYFEEKMIAPNSDDFYAEWSETGARGQRKSSKSLWVYEKRTGKKRYSVTTSAGIKIQPYFDVPSSADPNLVHFRVQSEPTDRNTTIMWVSGGTAEALKSRLGTLAPEVVESSILDSIERDEPNDEFGLDDVGAAIAIEIDSDVFERFAQHWDAVNDDHRLQLLMKFLS
ncbi:hypothetical protein [Donghicola mangrovi]|uniref:Uncharacterized protein n=1 Tax=Donghicola mangrovi TaxID=2729614 RepID=A0A850QIU9_9RHOB|nr:hypothetical protein [Donghicola mangrovi]NVO25721.1 hypothetical protein [Donghicola mangrovi]